MKLIITLVKEVSDLSEARQRVEQIKGYIAPVEGVKITARTNEQLEPPEDE